MKQTFTAHDAVIPRIAPKYEMAIPVSVVVTDEGVSLTVGPRHLKWDRETGKLVAVETLFEPRAPVDSSVYLG